MVAGYANDNAKTRRNDMLIIIICVHEKGIFSVGYISGWNEPLYWVGQMMGRAIIRWTQ